MIYFGIKLKQLRSKNSLSQKQLADALGLAKSSISQYETGANRPDVDNLIKIASFFQVSIDYLVGLTGEQKFDLLKLTDEQSASILEVIHQYTICNANNRTMETGKNSASTSNIPQDSHIVNN